MSDQATGTETSPAATSIWSGEYLPVTLSNLTIVSLVGFGTLALVAALSSIAEDLGHVSLLPWVFTSYLATSSIAVVVAGPVIDAIGVRRTFRVTVVWFLLATAGATVAPTMVTLIVARAVQGFGGGLAFAVSLAAIGLGYPPDLRRRAFAAQSVMFGIMGFGGPAFAGFLLSLGGWRVIFAIQLPLTAVALLTGWRRLPTTREHPARIQTDWKGVALLSLVIICSLVAVSQIGVRWWAASVATGGTALLVASYWRHATKIDEPVLALEHLTRFPHRWIHVTTGLVMFTALAVDNFLPLYIQTARGRSVEFAALSLIYLTIGWSFGSVVYSRVLRKWHESQVILLGTGMIVPFIALAGATVAFDWPLAVLFVAIGFVGLSVGLVSTSGLVLLQDSSEPSEMGRVTAAHQFIRQLAIMYGIALAGAIILLVVDIRVGDIDAVRDVIAGEDMALGTETQDAIRDGLAWVHVATGVIALGGTLVARSLVRRTRSGVAT
jgi:MFS family permease